MITNLKRELRGQKVTFNDINDLFEVYERLSYDPEFYDDNTILIKCPVQFIVHYVDTDKLSLNMLHKLWIPLQEASEFTGIKNYIVISKEGFEDSCFQVEGYSIRLETFEYVKELLEAKHDSKPLELLPHNQLAYKNLKTMWETKDLAAIIHATGTGKSYIITKTIQNCTGKTIIICPTIYILEQFEELLNSSCIPDYKVDLYTYAKVSRLTKSELALMKYDLIIIDEFHRVGARVWGMGVVNILTTNPNSKVLGTSATPIRYLDDRRNMVEELFEGNVASSLDLFEAIARGILPAPKYIEALYDITSDISALESNVSKTTMSIDKKEEILESIRKFKVSWDSVKTISNIIEQHFTIDTNKVMVFCKNVSHIKEMIPIVERWFEKSGVFSKVNSYMSYSTLNDERDELDEFKKEILPGEVNLLFSVDKVTEGVHVDATAVIFLRSTTSNNVLLQQIGRALSATQNTTPIILDLINNVEILETQNFYDSINKSIYDFNSKRNKLNLISDATPNIDVKFSVRAETKDFISFLENTLKSISKSWDDMLKLALECKDRTGWFPGPLTPDEDQKLIHWVSRQRILYANTSLREDKFKKLKSVNFPFTFIKEKWLKMYDRLIKYKEEKKLDDFTRHIIDDNSLNLWVTNQRRRKTLNQIESEEYDLLLKAGISFDLNSDIWNYYIKRLSDFYKENGHRHPTDIEDSELAIFSRIQRKRYKDGVLPKDKIKLLENINFLWVKDDIGISFIQRIEHLKLYIAEFGDTRVPARYSGYNKLGEWTKRVRTQRRKDELSQEKIEILNSLKFCWDPKTTSEDELIKKIVEYTLKKRDPNDNTIATKSLGMAMSTIRKRYFNDALEQKHIDSLNSIQFDWTPVKNTWSKRLNQLKDYHSIYKTFKISQKSDYPDSKALFGWIQRQKNIYKKGSYPEEKIIQLRDIGLDLGNIK